MFKRILQRYRDMKALSVLVEAAEGQSKKRGEGSEPSTEHFILAAIESKDGAAKEVFQTLGLDAELFEDALREQYKRSLNSIGIDVDDESLRSSSDFSESKLTGLPRVAEPGGTLMRVMSQQNAGKAFSGADVLRAIDSVPAGPAHRAFTIMGTSADKVALAADAYVKKLSVDRC